VRRVVELIAAVTAGCHESVTVRSAARVAARSYVEHYPDSFVVVFEREPGKDIARAVTGANMPTPWHMRAVNLTEVPLLARALLWPRELARGGAVRRDASIDIGAQHAICAAIPDPVQPLYALMVVGPKDPPDQEEREFAIEAIRHVLSASVIAASGNVERPQALAAIHHAKIEWEQTADALPEVVGLLDSRGRIVRISRALERWGLGTITAAIRRDLHQAFHHNCDDSDCALRAALAQAWNEFAANSAARIEHCDARLGLDLIIELRPVGVGAEVAGAPRLRTAFVITNVTRLRRAERELTSLIQTLENRVEERTTQINDANRILRLEVARRREVEMSLRESKTELEGLSERLMSAQEEERKRISQDLHDTIGQSLSAIKYSLERARELAVRSDSQSADEVIGAVIGRVQRVVDDVRGISMNLRPALLDDLGAASAVRWMCREWHDVYRDIAVDMDITVDDAEIPTMLGTSVFRSVQELLNNVARHADARRVLVQLGLDAGRLCVTVADDGAGFAVNGNGHGHAPGTGRPGPKGLRGLMERAEQTGGRCLVDSQPGRGTTVRLEWPIAPGLAAREANVSVN